MKTKHFTQNITGRDFVVGDLHGCVDLFNATLEAISFNKDKDRMFSVGDLGDRGPYSPACMDLMFQPWFQAVRSNHGDLMNQYVSPANDAEARFALYNWMPNGGQWSLDVPDDTMLKYAEADEALPYLLTVDLPNGTKFHVIHAEFSTREPLTDKIILSEEASFLRKVKDAGLKKENDGNVITWGRNIFRQFFNEPLHTLKDFSFPKEHLNFFNSNLSTIYSGHTVMKEPTKYLGQINIDTGAVFSGEDFSLGLTVTEPLTGKFWKTNYKQGTKEVPLVIIT